MQMRNRAITSCGMAFPILSQSPTPMSSRTANAFLPDRTDRSIAAFSAQAKKQNVMRACFRQFALAGRSFATSDGPGSTDAPSTYLKSTIVPSPFSTASFPT